MIDRNGTTFFGLGERVVLRSIIYQHNIDRIASCLGFGKDSLGLFDHVLDDRRFVVGWDDHTDCLGIRFHIGIIILRREVISVA